MKDLHTHILYGIDDGSRSLSQSIELLKTLEQEGVTDLVVTPHYIIGTNYNSNNSKKKELLDELRKNTKIKLYLGNEIYIDNNIIEFINRDEISSINNSRYLLIEFPLTKKLEFMNEILFEVRKKGYIPVIAHPERYHYLSLKELIDLVNSGCLLQGNITSLNGKYGEGCKKNLELLLKKHMIHVLGTDTHRNADIELDSLLKKLSKIVDNKYLKELTDSNFDKIINNEKFDEYEIFDTSTFFRKEKVR